MRRRGLAFLILLAAAAGGLMWSLSALFPGAPEEIDAAQVRRGTLEITLPLSGIVETRSVELGFEIPGRLATLSVPEGQAVTAGALLATVDDTELRALAAQADAAATAAGREAARAQAAVETSRRQAAQSDFAARAARAALAQVRAGPRPADLAQAEAAVAAAQAALDEARRALGRSQALFRDGAITQAQLDAAGAQVEGAEARHRQALAQLDALRAGPRPEAVTTAEEQAHQAEAAHEAALAAVRQAEGAAAAARAHAQGSRAAAAAARARVGRAQLRAPFTGIVTRIYLQPGAAVAPAIPVLTLTTPTGWVTAEIDEADIGQVQVGQRSRVTADAYPGRTFLGRVTAIGRQVEVRLGTRVVRARIDLEGGGGMRPGTTVDVELVRRRIPNALLAPAEAVYTTPADGAPYVYLVEGVTLRRRAVRPGPSNDRETIILAGLRVGDLVAVADPGVLRDGVKVKIRSVR
jgi:HlyD family secretion protein